MGITHVSDGDEKLKQFNQLQMKLAAPHSHFYKYLQLRHDFNKGNTDKKIYSTQFIPNHTISPAHNSNGLI